ncbi:hypothetical protein LZ32DRAFT_651338 [Colletotrichum eremochloae]|nr:hypothetical protein LZ32DRAFT_651338 [Colletotrichum eremochloae]
MSRETYFRAISTRGPESFAYFVVARFEPTGRHLPLAIVSIEGSSEARLRDGYVLKDCLQVINVFAAPANRAAIEAELGLASHFYRTESSLGERIDLPEPSSDLSSVVCPHMAYQRPAQREGDPEDPFAFGHMDSMFDEVSSDVDSSDFTELADEDSYAVSNSRIPEFPFILTSLLLGLGHDTSRNDALRMHIRPLCTVFNDCSLKHGMVVIDISDLNHIRYGIVAFEISEWATVSRHPLSDWDPVEDRPPEDDPVLKTEQIRSREPLSAVQYMDKFNYNRYTENWAQTTRLLEGKPLIDPNVMDYIWPRGDIVTATDQQLHQPLPNTLHHQAVRRLVKDVQGIEQYNMSIFEIPLLLPEFRETLKLHLGDNPDCLGPNIASGQLLGLAYAGQQDLDWTAFKGLSFENVSAALQFSDLEEARSLSLCIDLFKDSPESLLTAIARMEAMENVSFLQDPERTDDEATKRLYLAVSSIPTHASLLGSKRLMFTCSYSSPLIKRPWLLPNTHYAVPKAYPVQQMFVRKQGQDTDDPGSSTCEWTTACFSLGDGLLRPERAATGLLVYLRGFFFGTDEHLFSFSRAPPSFKEFSPGAEISPILAEVAARPPKPDHPRTTDEAANARRLSSTHRKIDEFTWTILVSSERYKAPEDDRPHNARTVQARLMGHMDAARYLRYAFVRVAQGDGPTDRTHGTRRHGAIEPGDIEVCDLIGFLKATKTNFDPSDVEKELNITSQVISRGVGGQPLRPEQGRLDVLEDTVACSIFQDLVGKGQVSLSNELAHRERPFN